MNYTDTITEAVRSNILDEALATARPRLLRLAQQSSSRAIAYSGMILGFLNLIAVSFPIIPVFLAIYLLGGGPVVVFFVGIYTLLQQSVPDAYRGRIFGAYSTTNTLFLLGGMFLSSTFTAVLGPLLMFALMGVFYFLAGAFALVLLRNAKIIIEKPTGDVVL